MKHFLFTFTILLWLLICNYIPNQNGSAGFFLVLGLIAIIVGWFVSTLD